MELKEFPPPEAEPGKAVVQIAFCGICGTDVHAYQSGAPYNPAICGHEWTGTVAAAAAGSELREGDRVAIGIATPCGECGRCQRGEHPWCERAFAGLIGLGPLAAPHGGFAPAIAIEAARLYPVDDALSDSQAAMLEPATIAVHAVRRTPMRLGDCVVVIGAGPIGLLVAQCARAAGAGAVIVVEPAPQRRALAESLGADLTIDPGAESPADALARFAGQSAADVVLECAGVPETIDQAVGLCRRGGAVSLVGVPAAPSIVDAAAWLVKEVELTTSLGYQREEFSITQQLVADGRLRLDPLHTATVPLTELPAAFATLAESAHDVKILVDPSL